MGLGAGIQCERRELGPWAAPGESGEPGDLGRLLVGIRKVLQSSRTDGTWPLLALLTVSRLIGKLASWEDGRAVRAVQIGSGSSWRCRLALTTH